MPDENDYLKPRGSDLPGPSPDAVTPRKKYEDRVSGGWLGRLFGKLFGSDGKRRGARDTDPGH